jgi:hypothetical protein
MYVYIAYSNDLYSPKDILDTSGKDITWCAASLLNCSVELGLSNVEIVGWCEWRTDMITYSDFVTLKYFKRRFSRFNG